MQLFKNLYSEMTLLLAKTHFFTRLAKLMCPFWKKFQTNAPMFPFLDHELSKILKSLMQNFVKASKLERHSTSAEMLAIDLEDDANLMDCAKVFVGLASKF